MKIFNNHKRRITAPPSSAPLPQNISLLQSPANNIQEQNIFPHHCPLQLINKLKTGKRFSRKAQVTIFIILAILIVGGVALFFVLRNTSTTELPKNIKPVYDYYLTCLQENAQQGILILGQQGGYIEPPGFVPGSQYMPFSSQMDFLGQPVSYWMYVSGNNLLKEQVPTKAEMQRQLEKYVSDRATECDFSDFYSQGYDVSVGENPAVSVVINQLNVEVNVKNLLTIQFENQSAVVNEEKIIVESKLGKFYDMAVGVYNYEKQNMFLESYALDVMRLYAPVTGVELTCAPKVFNEQKIRQDLTTALSENIGMLKLKGSYYSLANEDNKYFVTDTGNNIDENVNFVYTSDMPSRIEIYGDKVVTPVGMQEGLGILGFCYVPYQLIYDIDFPVLIQFYDNKEIFQFPVSVVISKNQARNALLGEAGGSLDSPVCQYKNQEMQILTYDSELNPVEASIKFNCLSEECAIGDTKSDGKEAIFNGGVPQCVNGFLVARADGYADAKYQVSTNEETTANIIMSRLYNVTINLGKVDSALVYFVSSDYSATAFYPDTKNIQLREGNYNISVYVYKNSSLVLPAVSEKKCTQVPKSGIGALVGMTEEKCFDINIPSQEISFVVVGGGKSQEYLAESQLKESNVLNLNVPLFKTPANIQEVQDNYISIEDSNVEVRFE